MGLRHFIKSQQTAIYTVLLLLVCGLFVDATYDEIISDKNKQIETFQKEIDETKSLARSHSTATANIQKQVDSVEALLKTLNDFLKDYQDQSFLSPDQVAIETNMVLFLEEEVANIQKSFKSKIVNLYKHGKNYELELLMSAKSPNEYLRRNEYLQRFAQNRKKELLDLKSKRFILEEKKKMLTLSVSSQRFYVETRRKDKDALQETMRSLSSEKSKIEFDALKDLAKIEKYEQLVNNTKSFIANFTSNQKNYKGNKTIRQNYSTENFDAIKANMNIPVDVGVVTSEFGEGMHNSTGSKTLSMGIDFSIAKGSKVYAVANGTVSLIGDLPYYGKVIIVNHENGYRTVYSVLSEVNVNIGDKIHLNQVIGKSGDTIDGQFLHFEIWQGTTPLNPRQWLKL